MEAKANDTPQVGGNHYRKSPGEQHWDRLIRLYGWPAARCYFIGNITSYVERYQDKNGVEDLQKARHYLDKMIEEETKYQQARMGSLQEVKDRWMKLMAVASPGKVSPEMLKQEANALQVEEDPAYQPDACPVCIGCGYRVNSCLLCPWCNGTGKTVPNIKVNLGDGHES